MAAKYLSSLLFVSLFLGFVWNVEADHSWSYKGKDGPTHWKKTFPKCAGKNQSPVDLGKSKPTNLPPLVLEGYDRELQEATIVNNGHSAQVEHKGEPATISGGCLDGKYSFLQFHFHWGSGNKKGSEHTILGKHYIMEGHFVHYNTKYTDEGEAKKNPDGLAVLGVFFTAESKDNPDLKPLMDATTKVQNKKVGAETGVDDGLRMRSMLPQDMSFYCYANGSLTTPSCDEAVVWTVLHQPVKIGTSQLNAFRKLKFSNGSPMVDNFRPVQSLNGRPVYYVMA